MILPRLGAADELEHVAKRLVACIEEPVQARGHIARITASVGLAHFDPVADDARSLLVKADLAMYAAKADPAHPWLIHHDGMRVPEGRLDK